MSDRFADVQKGIAQHAAEEFADHVLTVEGPSEWRCGKPGTGIMAFRVLCRPGMVAIWGDLGEWVLRVSDRNPVPWIRGAVRSPDYLLSKVKAGERLSFYPADARALLDDPETAASWGAEVVEKVREELGSTWGDEATQEEWYVAWSNAGADETPDCEYPTIHALWLVEMLRKFVDLEANLSHDKDAPTPADLAVADEIEAGKRPEDRFKRPAALPSVERHRCLSRRATGTRAIYFLTVEYPEVPHD